MFIKFIAKCVVGILFGIMLFSCNMENKDNPFKNHNDNGTILTGSQVMPFDQEQNMTKEVVCGTWSMEDSGSKYTFKLNYDNTYQYSKETFIDPSNEFDPLAGKTELEYHSGIYTINMNEIKMEQQKSFRGNLENFTEDLLANEPDIFTYSICLLGNKLFVSMQMKILFRSDLSYSLYGVWKYFNDLQYTYDIRERQIEISITDGFQTMSEINDYTVKYYSDSNKYLLSMNGESYNIELSNTILVLGVGFIKI